MMATREETKRMIEVMQAYVDGAEIEYRDSDGGNWDRTQPCWIWSDYNYRIVDPYAKLKAAAEDPTKQIRCIAPMAANNEWISPGKHGWLWKWNYAPDQYEIRDKPKRTAKLLAYYSNFDKSLHWTDFERKSTHGWYRVPSEDKEVEIEE